MSIYHKTDFKAFVKGFIIFVILLIIVDRLIGNVFKYYYFKQKSGVLYQTTYVIDSTKASVLVFGSSRANHHYIPAIFENKLHMTFYNCGRDNCNLIYYAAVISAVLERYTPKQIILDLIPYELSLSEDGKLSPLLPYQDNPAVKPFLKFNSKFEDFKLLSTEYPYNSLLGTIITGNLSHSDKQEGYIELDKVMPSRKKAAFESQPVIAARARILNDLFKKLYAKNIKVAVVISPAYCVFDRNDENAKTIEQLSDKYKNIQFFNYENNPAFDNNKLYQDNFHLNGTGAQKFSMTLAQKLSECF